LILLLQKHYSVSNGKFIPALLVISTLALVSTMPKRSGSIRGSTSTKRSKAASSNLNNKKKSVHRSVLDYDSDVEPPPPADDERLDWRLDPAESLSDWTIQIVSGGAATTTDFHVHKSVLAVGARKSEYFGRLFLGQHAFAEAANCTSRIELHPLAATAFELFLDYVYNADGELQISTETATALHYLAGYFENRRLRWEAKQFWKTDLTLETAGTYYEHAEIFRDDKIATAVTDLCVAQIDDITPKLSLFRQSTPQLWMQVLPKAQRGSSRHLSQLMASFCAAHRDTLDVATYQELTSEASLPEIDCQAALPLMDLERQLVVAPQPDADANAPDPAMMMQPTDLQQRCLTSLYGNWASVPVHQNQELQERLHQQSPQMLVNLLASAQSDVVEVSKRLEEARGDLIRMQDELSDKEQELRRSRRMQMLSAGRAPSAHQHHLYRPQQGAHRYGRPTQRRVLHGTASDPLDILSSSSEQSDSDDFDDDSSASTAHLEQRLGNARIRGPNPFLPHFRHEQADLGAIERGGGGGGGRARLFGMEMDDTSSSSSSSSGGRAIQFLDDHPRPPNEHRFNSDDDSISSVEAFHESLQE